MRPDPPGTSDSVASMRTVSRLSIAPVKSMALVHPDEIDLQPWGAVGNRVFCWVSPEGRLVGGAQQGTLVQIRACHDPATDELTLTFPGGTVVRGSGSDRSDAMLIDIWGRGAPAHVIRGPFADAVSAFAGRPLLLVRPDEPGAANDDLPVSILSTASMGALVAQAGTDVPNDARRFRMLVDVDGCERPHEEDEWIGRRVRVGGAVLRVAQPIPRCAVTTQDPSTGIRDFKTLHVIKDYRGVRGGKYLDFGVGARVEEPGPVRLGDVVEPLDD
jgi:MOSC domain-containing protein